MRRVVLVLVMCAALAAAGCGRAPSRDSLASHEVSVDRVLRNTETREQLTYLTGVAPTILAPKVLCISAMNSS